MSTQRKRDPSKKSWAEPWKVKKVEPVRWTSREYRRERMKEAGCKYVVPTHQGRGAKYLVSKIYIKKGDFVPGNMHFTTTRVHQELAGGTFTDVIVDEAHDPESDLPFKGNVGLGKLEDLIKKVGRDAIPYVSLAATVNMAGGAARVDAKRARSARFMPRVRHPGPARCDTGDRKCILYPAKRGRVSG